MAAAGSNVTLSLVSVSVPTAEIMYSILTSGRYEDGYIAVFDENNTEISRTSSFRAYGNSSGSTTVTGLSTGHVYTGKFYSSDLSMYSDSVVIIDTRSGTPSYDVSTSMTGTSVTVTLGPTSTPATMGRDGSAIVDMIAVGGEAPDSPISNSIEYKSTDASVSTTFFGLTPTTTYTFLVSYYDPGTSTDRLVSVTANTTTANSHFVPKFYGGIGENLGSEIVDKLYGPGDDVVFDNLQLKGDTYQQTYSGKNLFDKAGSTLVSINVSGYTRWGYKLPKVANDFYFTKSIDDQIGFRLVEDVNGSIVSLGNVYTMNFATKFTNTSNDMYVLCFATQNKQNAQGYFDNNNFMMSYTNVAYEPYTGGIASPNPDYPQDIGVVTGEQTVTVSDGNNQSATYSVNLGKNLFDKNSLSDGWIDSTGSTNTDNSWKRTDYVPIKPNTNYTTSGFANGSGVNPARCYYDSSKVFISGVKHNGANPFSNTSPANAYYMIECCKTSDIDTVQIEAGSATTYAPYFTPIELCKIGDYQDYIYKSGDDWYVRKEIGKVVLDGDENVAVNSTGTTNWFYAIADSYDNAASNRIISSHYIYNGSITASNTIQGASITSGGVVRVRFGAEDTAVNYQTWLTNNNVTLYYALATPTDTKITNQTLIGELEALRTGALGDDTNVSVSGNLPVIIGYDAIENYATKLKKLYGSAGPDNKTKLIHVNRQKKGPTQGIITLQAQESGTMTIADKWTTPIIVENITQGTTPITVETIDSTSISVEDGDIITIAESSINSTFRYWDQGYYNYRPLISGVACHIIDMPPIDRFTIDLNGTTADDSFFKAFNCNGSITSLPAGSFDISSITTIGDGFFYGFNLQGPLASLPAGSFDISNITTVGNFFFASFNYGGPLTSLPAGSFDTSNITTAGTFFFAGFNSRVFSHPEIVGELTSLPIGSFDTSNITTIGDYSFADFNLGGHIPKSTNSYNPNFINSLSSFIDAYYWDGSVSVSEFVQAGDPFYYLES